MLTRIGKRFPSLLLVTGLLVILFVAVKHYQALKNRSTAKKDMRQDLVSVSVPRGQQKKLDLPDGSTVWLNAASFLTYPGNMNRDGRTVELNGEGFFVVKNEPEHPFRVRARDMMVEVLGTQFNIRDYPEETIVQTVLKEGAVKVTHADEQVVLHPGESVELESSRLRGPTLTVHSGVDAGAVMEWTKGYLKFTGVNLTTLLHELSRAYDIDIRLEGDMPGVNFYGSFSRELPVEEVLKLLNGHDHVVEITWASQRSLTVRVLSL